MLWAQVSTFEFVEKAKYMKTHKIFGIKHNCGGTAVTAIKARGPGKPLSELV